MRRYQLPAHRPVRVAQKRQVLQPRQTAEPAHLLLPQVLRGLGQGQEGRHAQRRELRAAQGHIPQRLPQSDPYRHPHGEVQIRREHALPRHGRQLPGRKPQPEALLKPAYPATDLLRLRIHRLGRELHIPFHPDQRAVQRIGLPLAPEGPQEHGRRAILRHIPEEPCRAEAEVPVQKRAALGRPGIAQGRAPVEAQPSLRVEALRCHGVHRVHRIHGPGQIACQHGGGQAVAAALAQRTHKALVPAPDKAHGRVRHEDVSLPLPQGVHLPPGVLPGAQVLGRAQGAHGLQVFLPRFLHQRQAIGQPHRDGGVLRRAAQGLAGVGVAGGCDQQQDAFHAWVPPSG